MVARSVDSCHEEARVAVSRKKGSVRFPANERRVEKHCIDEARMAISHVRLRQNGHDGARVVVWMWPARRLLSLTGSRFASEVGRDYCLLAYGMHSRVGEIRASRVCLLLTIKRRSLD